MIIWVKFDQKARKFELGGSHGDKNSETYPVSIEDFAILTDKSSANEFSALMKHYNLGFWDTDVIITTFFKKLGWIRVDHRNYLNDHIALCFEKKTEY